MHHYPQSFASGKVTIAWFPRTVIHIMICLLTHPWLRNFAKGLESFLCNISPWIFFFYILVILANVRYYLCTSVFMNSFFVHCENHEFWYSVNFSNKLTKKREMKNAFDLLSLSNNTLTGPNFLLKKTKKQWS